MRVARARWLSSVALLLGLAPVSGWGQDVGIIKGRSGCPLGAAEVGIAMDNEDTNQASSLYGWVGATRLDSNGNITYRFCRVSGALFADAPGEFAVLRLGVSCPAGSEAFTRFFDNENHNNKNQAIPSTAAISPNSVRAGDYNGGVSNSNLVFCRFSAGTGSFPLLGVEYGVFGNAASVPAGLEFGYAYSDDEDTWPSTNWNSYRYDALTWFDETRYARYSNLIDGEQNTVLRMARVTSTPPPTRPVAYCGVTPSSAVDYAMASFGDAGSYARNGRVLVSYAWTFDDGSVASGPGPHDRFVSVDAGQSLYFSGVLTVTDNAGEQASASCGLWVTSSSCSGAVPCYQQE